jgi:hypothetical protein
MWDPGETPTTFEGLFQARFAGLNGSMGPLTVPGLNTGPYGSSAPPLGQIPFELTVVAKFTEQVMARLNTNLDPFFEVVTLTVVPSATSFFEMWFDSPIQAGAVGSVPSDDLLGVGFNDGKLILTGSLSSGDSSFFVPSFAGPFPAMDGFGIDDYPLIDSIDGSGSSSDLAGAVSGTHPSFFTGLLPPAFISLVITDSLQEVPYDSVNPSDKWVLLPSGAVLPGLAPNASSGTVDTGPDTVALLNTVGPLNGASGPDFAQESDAQTELKVAQAGVPEPSTLLLSLVGAGALGLRQLRGRRRKL